MCEGTIEMKAYVGTGQRQYCLQDIFLGSRTMATFLHVLQENDFSDTLRRKVNVLDCQSTVQICFLQQNLQ